MGISPRTYYATPSLLPEPMRVTNKWVFAEHEIDERIEELLATRNTDTNDKQATGR